MKLLSFFLIPALSAAACAQVVINEIHYDPPDVTKREEFIELHNPSGAPVSLAGWKIEDAVAYTFAPGATIPADGYLVVAENPTQFQARYGFTPLGPWTGSLRNSGERITLKNASAVVMDEVDYGSGFPWPTGARGAGQSMELIHPSLDNDLGGSWRAKPPTLLIPRGAGGWSYRPGTSEASSPIDAWRGAGFAQDGTWVTGATLPLGYGEPGLNTTITGMQNSYWSIFLRKTFTLAAGEIPDMLVLRVRADDGCVAWVNGQQFTPTYRTAGGPVFNGGAGGMTITNVPEPAVYEERVLTGIAGSLNAGTNVLALQIFNTTLNSSDLLIDAELAAGTSGGTPGVQNSVFSTIAPPQIRQVAHTPAQPAANVPVVITAKITDPQGVASATLSYQLVNPGSYIRLTDAAYSTTWTNLAMNDAGTGGDAVAGDGTYSVTLPAALQTHRRLVRYRITATDTGGASVQVPYVDDEQPNFAYFVYNGVPAYSGVVQSGAAGARGAVQTFPPALLNTMQIWQLITNAADHDAMLYNSSFNGQPFWGTFVYEGKVYDHIKYNVRGIGSTYVSGKNKFALKFNRARDVRFRDNWGKYFDADWNSVPVDACASPWAAVHRGMSGVEEAAGYRLYELADMASLRTTYLHLRVVRDANEAGTGQYDTDFWGLYMALEPTEGNFLDERGLPDGNIYAIEGTNGDKKHQGATHPADASDWITFRNSATQAGQTEAWYRANMDLDAFLTFFALNRFSGNVDVRPGDNYRFYRRSSDNRWVIIPYDLDMMALPAHHWGGTLADGVVWAGASSQSVLLSRHPALAIELRNRARELMSLLGSDNSTAGGQIGQLIDEYAQMVKPGGTSPSWVDADEVMWCNHPRTIGGGGNAGQTSHRNNFFRTPFNDTRGNLGGTTSTAWTRTLPDPDGNGYATFEDQMNYLKNFMTNTWPGGAWLRSNGNPAGYGWKYLEWESQYGGHGDANNAPGTAPDTSFPNTPSLTYAGPAGFPANALDFTSSAFSDPQGAGTFAAMQWRIGEIYAPGIPGYIAGSKRRYEVEQVWTSPEITTFTAMQRIPLTPVEPGRTYRARVRHKDNTGRWSFWSAPITFTAGTPDVSSYVAALVISEINYNPAPVTPAEFAAGFSSDDFEWVEVKNTSALPVDMTGIRFTKGIDFDFPDGWTIPPGGFALVVRNLAAFQMRYGTAFNGIIAGTTSDNFSNSGEQVKLSYGAGTTVVDFTYGDTAPWPTAADGTGKTLALRNPGSHPDPAIGTNWKASYATGGSPAADDVLSFDVWSADFPGVTDLLGDNDGDLLRNLVEYGLGGNPLANDPAPMPVSGVQSFNVGGVPGEYLTLVFTRRTDASDIQFHVEFANDPAGTWSPGVIEGSATGPDAVTELWRAPVPHHIEPAQFGRVRVVKP